MAGIYHQAGCCCAEAVNCFRCPGTDTPLRITAVFSGIQNCTGCFIDRWKWTSQPSIGPNGTFVCRQTASNPCIWEYTVACTGEYVWYGRTPCLSPIETYTVNSMRVRIAAIEMFGVGSWTVTFAYLGTGDGPGTYPTTSAFVACPSRTVDECMTPASGNNTQTVCRDFRGLLQFHINGSVTITPT